MIAFRSTSSTLYLYTRWNRIFSLFFCFTLLLSSFICNLTTNFAWETMKSNARSKQNQKKKKCSNWKCIKGKFMWAHRLNFHFSTSHLLIIVFLLFHFFFLVFLSVSRHFYVFFPIQLNHFSSPIAIILQITLLFLYIFFFTRKTEKKSSNKRRFFISILHSAYTNNWISATLVIFVGNREKNSSSNFSQQWLKSTLIYFWKTYDPHALIPSKKEF